MNTDKPTPEPAPEAPKAERGLYDKFVIRRRDGRDAPGQKHDGCRYFVLDMDHDEHAKDALRAYAEACSTDLPALADDLREWLGDPALDQEGEIRMTTPDPAKGQELLGCPFCGGEPESAYNDRTGLYSMRCLGCGVCLLRRTYAIAAAAWNRRAAPGGEAALAAPEGGLRDALLLRYRRAIVGLHEAEAINADDLTAECEEELRWLVRDAAGAPAPPTPEPAPEAATTEYEFYERQKAEMRQKAEILRRQKPATEREEMTTEELCRWLHRRAMYVGLGPEHPDRVHLLRAVATIERLAAEVDCVDRDEPAPEAASEGLRVCSHGHLARACEVCERDGEIAALRSLLAQREAALRELGGRKFRENCKSAFYGGHSGRDAVIFRHGMDTVCNVIEGKVRRALEAK